MAELQNEEQGDHPDEITVVFEDEKDRRAVPVNGAFGGLAPNGQDVVAHIYLEHQSVPNLVTHRVDESGRVDLDEGDSIARGEITRKVQTSLAMSPEAAIRIGEWLKRKGQTGIQQRDDSNTPGQSQ